jgi:protein-tyrosine kinase
VVLVVEAEKTKWPVIQDVKEKLISHGGNILGIVFNKRRYYIPRWLYNRI